MNMATVAMTWPTRMALMESFPLERVRVRVRKRGVAPAGLAVEYTAVIAERAR